MMRMALGSRKLVLVAAATMTALGVGCTRSSEPVAQPQKPIVLNIETQKVSAPQAANRMAELKHKRQARSLRATVGQELAASVAPIDASPAITGQVTLARSEIFGREFLYGADLQYSSLDEGGMMAQAYAIGHDVVRFREQGDRLQLVADQRYLFESNINHPERLVHEFPIEAKTADTITISVRKGSPTLVTVLGDAKAGAPRASWVRSLEYVPNGNYLLIETSIESADGIVAEFMESVFPRETIVPPGAQPLLGDPAFEPFAARYRFLTAGLWLDLPHGRTQTAVASRYHVPEGKVIEWWITPNVPAKYLHLIQTGVEGWNRYSQKMWGKDLTKFRGVLPDGVKIGDPRYNVISWDSVLDAGSAYESQAYDLTTGIQSHSLIYLPYAWIKFGEEFWSEGGITQNEKSAAAVRRFFNKATFLGRPLNPRCLHEVAEQISLESRRTPEDFGKELLKVVLMHEVGHALGLAHNFKGSLVMNPDDPTSMFSSSIMDYNHYQLEDAVYESEHSSDGPLLEYDRQILSVLYNDAKDVALTDPVLPACDNADADRKEGGVDPLCIWYDAGQDPTEYLSRLIQLVLDPSARLGKTKSLAASISETPAFLPEPTSVATEDAVLGNVEKVTNQFFGLFSFYYVNGAQSIRSMVRANIRALYEFQPGVLPAPYNEHALRERVVSAITQVVNWSSVDPSAKAALNSAQREVLLWVKATPWYLGLSAERQSTVIADLEADFFAPILPSVESVYLMRTRASTLANLVRDEGVSFFFSLDVNPAQDLEKLSIDILENALTQPLAGEMRSLSERESAAKSLYTFASLPEGQAAISRAAASVNTELSKARTSREREDLRKLLKTIHGG